MAVSPVPGGQLGAKLAECGEPCCGQSPVSPLPAGIELSGGVLPGCPEARCFVRTIPVAVENNEIDIAPDQNRPLEISRIEFESDTRVSGGEPVRTLDADALLLLGALVAGPKNRDSLPITIQSPVSG
jgi:hypothetical protein